MKKMPQTSRTKANEYEVKVQNHSVYKVGNNILPNRFSWL